MTEINAKLLFLVKKSSKTMGYLLYVLWKFFDLENSYKFWPKMTDIYLVNVIRLSLRFRQITLSWVWIILDIMLRPLQ